MTSIVIIGNKHEVVENYNFEALCGHCWTISDSPDPNKKTPLPTQHTHTHITINVHDQYRILRLKVERYLDMPTLALGDSSK